MTANTTARTCDFCKKTMRGYIAVTRYDAANVQKQQTQVCGLFCLTQWAYNRAILAGVGGVVSAKQALTSLTDFLKGR